MWFLNELELYKTVKPYRLDFDPDDEDFPRTNVDRIEVLDVPIHDIRAFKDRLQFSKCGFSILNMPSLLIGLDYDHKETVQSQYYSYLEEAVREFTEPYHKGAQVIALDHKVRSHS